MLQETSYGNANARILPHLHDRLDNGKILVTGYFGGWAILSEEEFHAFKAGNYRKTESLYSKLMGGGIIINDSNMNEVSDFYRDLNWNLLLPPSLHMFNTTNICNYRCSYCHAGVSQGKDFMDIKTALKALKFIFKSSGKALTIEFQGGECLLNWKVVKLAIEKSKELNKIFNKDMHICIISNLSLLNEEKLSFLANNDVAICSSLDGPEIVHDTNRKTAAGADTYDKTIEKIKFIQDYYKKNGMNRKVDLLATISKQALPYPEEIVDTYASLGIQNLHLRPVQHLGDALGEWGRLSYSPEEFFQFWRKAMKRIFEHNRNGIEIMERGAYNILCKILIAKDPLYVEQMNPAGLGRCALLYNYDGSIYSSDEGRMISEPVFKIGTVDQKPKEVLTCKENIKTWLSSYLDLTCYNSPYRAWGGIHPVHIYQDWGTIIPRASQYSTYKIYAMQCKYLFDKISENGFELELFHQWVQREIK